MQQMEPEDGMQERQNPGYYPAYREAQEYESPHSKLDEPITSPEQKEDFSDEFITRLAEKLSKRPAQPSTKKKRKENLLTPPQLLGLAFTSLLLTIIVAITLFTLFGLNTFTLIALGIICLTILIINEQYS